MAPNREDEGPLAHSAPHEGMRGDPYVRHVKAVYRGAMERTDDMLRYAGDAPPGLRSAVEAAATFHDLGKLDPDIQAALREGRRSRLRWDHIDAGVAHLSAPAQQNWMAAWLVRAHHAPGLPQKAQHFTEKTDRRLRGRRRDDDSADGHDEQVSRTDSLIESYLCSHETVMGAHRIERQRPIHGLTMRLALSCLVDADHSDSAFYDTGHLPPVAASPRWAERLRSLCEYVGSLPAGEGSAQRHRNRRRREFFEGCLNSRIEERIISCEGPVGVGKTTAVAAYLIRRARDENLRRLIIVAPFTNILSQTAGRLRKALVLPDEEPGHVIVEQHHRADFSHQSERELALLWHAPIVLTTAVSFFETLAARKPAALRKLHAVPGSAIFIDEAHAALPTKLWPQNWMWIRELAEQWGCRFVLASGSLVRFWDHQDTVEQPIKLQSLATEQANDGVRDEQSRVRFVQAAGGQVLTVQQLIDLVKNEPGPRLVILNTVQSAAVVAKAMRERCMDVLHLSTALTPCDRDVILGRIERRLQFPGCPDWTLVATSCVEAGVDISFRCAFRERFTVASTIQVGGRVNRHGEYSSFGGGAVYDFAIADKGITQHPAANTSADVLRSFLDADKLNTDTPADVVTAAMREELRRTGGLGADLLVKAESERDYPKVEELGRVIDADTRFVVIDPVLKDLLRERVPVDSKTLLRGSVQLWAYKIDQLKLEVVSGREDIYAWNDTYDPEFLGYMAGVLKLEEFMDSGGAVI